MDAGGHSAAACGRGGPSVTGTGMGVCTIRQGGPAAYRHSEPAHSLLPTSEPVPPTAGASAAWGPAAASAAVLCGDMGPLRRWAAVRGKRGSRAASWEWTAAVLLYHLPPQICGVGSTGLAKVFSVATVLGSSQHLLPAQPAMRRSNSASCRLRCGQTWCGAWRALHCVPRACCTRFPRRWAALAQCEGPANVAILCG